METTTSSPAPEAAVFNAQLANAQYRSANLQRRAWAVAARAVGVSKPAAAEAAGITRPMLDAELETEQPARQGFIIRSIDEISNALDELDEVGPTRSTPLARFAAAAKADEMRTILVLLADNQVAEVAARSQMHKTLELVLNTSHRRGSKASHAAGGDREVEPISEADFALHDLEARGDVYNWLAGTERR